MTEGSNLGKCMQLSWKQILKYEGKRAARGRRKAVIASQSCLVATSPLHKPRTSLQHMQTHLQDWKLTPLVDSDVLTKVCVFTIPAVQRHKSCAKVSFCSWCCVRQKIGQLVQSKLLKLTTKEKNALSVVPKVLRILFTLCLWNPFCLISNRNTTVSVFFERKKLLPEMKTLLAKAKLLLVFD